MNNMPIQQGWQCPVCGTVNAPWKPVCDCQVLNNPIYSNKSTGQPSLDDYLKRATTTAPETHYGYSTHTTQLGSGKTEGDLNGVHTSIRN